MPTSYSARLVVALAGVVGVALASEVARKADDARLNFPADYRQLEVVRRTNLPNKKQVGTVYANAAAAAVKDLEALPYPNGAMFVFEWAEVKKDEAGVPIAGADGLWERAEVKDVDVMIRGAGRGETEGEARAGEWEFARFSPEGKPVKIGAESMECAKCHRDAAARDFVFRGRFPAMTKKAM